ncbi:MAG: haloacid dehalogenase-like hydrolase [Candidatus Krumholzibacteriia bacterium]
MATILCDLDGTLLRKRDLPGADRPTAKRRAINQALAEAFHLPDVDFRQGMVDGLTDWRIAEGAVQAWRPEAVIDGPAWQRICARAEALFTPFQPGDEPRYARLPGIPRTLQALRDAGHRLGIVTGNVSFFAVDKLVHAGIDRALFDGPCGFGDHGRERHQIVRLAAARAGADAVLVVLGDTVHDLEGAQAVGLPFLGVGTSGLCAADLGEASGAGWIANLADADAALEAIAALTA